MRKLANRFLNRIETWPVQEVTRIRAGAEQPPEAGGMTAAQVQQIWQSVVDCYQEGLQPAIGLCVRRHGEVMLDRTIGHIQGNYPHAPASTKKVLATPEDSLFNLFSASKSVTAMAMHHLDQSGLIHLDDHVVEYLPDMGSLGKDKITIRQLINHTAGLPTIPGDMVDMDILQDPQKIRALMRDMPVQHHPGRTLAYHALSGGFVMNEIVREVTGKDLRAYLQEHILNPLGFEHMNYGVSEKDFGRVATHYCTGEPSIPPFSNMMTRALGVPFEKAIELSNDPRFMTSVIPSGNVFANANEASRFFQLLLNGGTLDGIEIFEPRTIRRATAEQTYLEFDAMLGFPVRYSMGFWLGSKWINTYGRHTEGAFGHMGFTNVILWADRERDISVALLTSGKPFISLGVLKAFNITWTISKVIPRIQRI